MICNHIPRYEYCRIFKEALKLRTGSPQAYCYDHTGKSDNPIHHITPFYCSNKACLHEMLNMIFNSSFLWGLEEGAISKHLI